jgi:hypothetical protein
MFRGQKAAVLGLTLALAAVTAALWLVPARRQGEDGLHRVFPGVESSSVARIEIRAGQDGDRVVVEREGERWVIREPLPAAADQARVTALAQALSTLEARDPLLGANPADFGLAEEAPRSVAFRLASGEGWDLRLGAPTAVGTGTYVLVEGEILPARGLLASTLLPALDDLRDRSLWRQDPLLAEAVAVALGDRGGEASVVEGAWRRGDGAPLDPERVDIWLRHLEEVRVAAFVPADAGAALGWVELAWPGGERQRVTATRSGEGGQVLWTTPGQPDTVQLTGVDQALLDEGLSLLGPPAAGGEAH